VGQGQGQGQGQGLLIIGASRSHSDTPHPLGFIWMSEQPVAETATYTTHNKHKREISMPRRDSNPPLWQENGSWPTP